MNGESNGKLTVKEMIPEIKFTKLFINGLFVQSLSGLSPCLNLLVIVSSHADESMSELYVSFCYLVMCR